MGEQIFLKVRKPWNLRKVWKAWIYGMKINKKDGKSPSFLLMWKTG